jgi:hypothetical protein
MEGLQVTGVLAEVRTSYHPEYKSEAFPLEPVCYLAISVKIGELGSSDMMARQFMRPLALNVRFLHKCWFVMREDTVS